MLNDHNADTGRMDETPTVEEFVASWLKKWGVDWPDKRSKQLVDDLRLLYGLPEFDGTGGAA